MCDFQKEVTRGNLRLSTSKPVARFISKKREETISPNLNHIVKTNSLGPKLPIIILLLRSRINRFLSFRRLRRQNMQRIFIRCINVAFFRRYGSFDFICLPSGGFDDAQIGRYCIVAFCAPWHVTKKNWSKQGSKNKKRFFCLAYWTLANA